MLAGAAHEGACPGGPLKSWKGPSHPDGGASAQLKAAQPPCPQAPLQPAGSVVDPLLLALVVDEEEELLLVLVLEELLALVLEELLALVVEPPVPGAPPPPLEETLVLGAPPADVIEPPLPPEPSPPVVEPLGGFEAVEQAPKSRLATMMRPCWFAPNGKLARILRVRCSSIALRCGDVGTVPGTCPIGAGDRGRPRRKVSMIS